MRKSAFHLAKCTVVVGGGYIGLEMAEAFMHQGIQTQVVTKGATVLSRTLDPDMGTEVTKRMRDMGIEVHTKLEVDNLEGVSGRVTYVGVSGGTRFDADIVLLGLGTQPEVQLAQEAGIPLGETGAVRVNARQQTMREGIWAAGDCAEAFHRVTQRPANFHLGTVANKQGRVAGMNIGGEYATFPGVLGTAITKVCDLEIGSTGLTEAEAAEAGFAYHTVTIDSTTKAGYWPGCNFARIVG